MHYYEIYEHLSSAIEEEVDKQLPHLGIDISWKSFISAGVSVLPGWGDHICELHQTRFENTDASVDTTSYPSLDIKDHVIDSNRNFKYPIVTSNGRNTGTIILLHGLNEKKWDKYMPWAYALAKKTGRAVVLFPIAFHMNRAPEEWSNARHMALVADSRRQHSNLHTSFVNAAISTRLEIHPQRFFWSGLQTYMDVTSFIKSIREGNVNGLKQDAPIDLFGYSIGVYFSLLLLMADPDRLLSDAKLFGFCGGTTMDRMYPSSRYILDYNAGQKLHDYFAKMVNKDFAGEERLAHYMSDKHKGEQYFKTMLLYHHFADERERRLKELENKIKVITLKKDTIIPPVEVQNTLNGRYRDINISVDIDDHNFPYSHVAPFSTSFKHAEQVDVSFESFIDKAALFYTT